jgi:hypothetical protein
MTALTVLVWLVVPRIMPDLIPLAITTGLVARVAHLTAMVPWVLAVGVILHLAYGAFWGGLFALSTASATATKGIVVGLGLWLLMIIFYVPMSGNAVVSVATNPAMWIVTLIGHVLYGAVVGSLLHRDQTRGFHGEKAVA